MNVIQKQSAAGRPLDWVTPLRDWALQDDWYIDEDNGSDANPGNTPALALATPAELSRRLSFQTLQPGSGIGSVTALTDLTAPINVLQSNLETGFAYQLQGTLIDVGSGTIVAVTPDASGQSPWALQTTGIDWTTLTGAQRRVELETGEVAMIGEVIDANNVRVGAFMSELGTATATPVATQAFTVSRPTSVPTLGLDIYDADYNPGVFLGFTPANVRVRNFDVVAAGQASSLFRSAQVFGSILRNPLQYGEIYNLKCCYRDVANGVEFFCADDGNVILIDGCVFRDGTGTFNAWGTARGNTFLRNRPWLREADMFFSGTAFMQLISGSPMVCEEFLISALGCIQKARLSLFSVVSGSSAVGGSRGFQIGDGAYVAYGSGTQPTVLGAAGAVRIGGVNFATYAGIPTITAANNAAMVVATN